MSARWLARAGVVAAAATAAATGLALPAHADHEVRLGNTGNVELQVGGGPQPIDLRVENRGNHPPATGTALNVSFTVTVPLGDQGVHIASAPPECSLSGNDTRMDCTIATIGPDSDWTGVAQIGVHGNSSLPPGESRNEQASVTLTGGYQGSTSFNVRVQGPDRPPSVPEVSGIVTNEQTGEGIDAAQVTMVDGADVDFTATTDSNGSFRFVEDNVTPGRLALRAAKDGYEGEAFTFTSQPGQPLTDIQLTLRSTSSPTPSTSTSASAEPTGTPSPTAAPAAEPGSSGGGTFFTTLLVVLGIILLVLGVAGLVLMLYLRRKRAREEGEDGPEGVGGPASGPPGPPRGPGAHGRYQPTPTQVLQPQQQGGLPAVGPQPTLAGPHGARAEAATQYQPRVADQTAMLPRVDPSAPGGGPGPGPGGLGSGPGGPGPGPGGLAPGPGGLGPAPGSPGPGSGPGSPGPRPGARHGSGAGPGPGPGGPGPGHGMGPGPRPGTGPGAGAPAGPGGPISPPSPPGPRPPVPGTPGSPPPTRPGATYGTPAYPPAAPEPPSPRGRHASREGSGYAGSPPGDDGYSRSYYDAPEYGPAGDHTARQPAVDNGGQERGGRSRGADPGYGGQRDYGGGQDYGGRDYGRQDYGGGGRDYGRQDYGGRDYGGGHDDRGREYGGGPDYGGRDYGGGGQGYGGQDDGGREYSAGRDYGGQDYGGHGYGGHDYGQGYGAADTRSPEYGRGYGRDPYPQPDDDADPYRSDPERRRLDWLDG